MLVSVNLCVQSSLLLLSITSSSTASFLRVFLTLSRSLCSLSLHPPSCPLFLPLPTTLGNPQKRPRADPLWDLLSAEFLGQEAEVGPGWEASWGICRETRSRKYLGPSSPILRVGWGSPLPGGVCILSGATPPPAEGSGSGSSSILELPCNVRRAQLCSPGDKLGRGWV